MQSPKGQTAVNVNSIKAGLLELVLCLQDNIQTELLVAANKRTETC